VIRAHVDGDRIVLTAALPPGTVAYVDKDWIPGSSGAVASIVAAENRTLAWCGGVPVPAPSGSDLDAASAAALLAVAREAATVERLATGPVEVIGGGLIAQHVRSSIPDSLLAGEIGRPKVIVDVTGDPRVIVDATRRLADLGILVLVGERPGQKVELNLYPDVHRRGLTVVGIPPPLQYPTFDAALEPDSPGLASSTEQLVHVRAGKRLPPGRWYRVSA
jgi:hypothetical protein